MCADELQRSHPLQSPCGRTHEKPILDMLSCESFLVGSRRYYAAGIQGFSSYQSTWVTMISTLNWVSRQAMVFVPSVT